MQAQRISLYYQDARSDKEYHAQLEAEGAGFVVRFQYGRRGGTLTTGTKTPAPVAYEVAKKAYDAIVKEKVGKGYAPGEGGAAFSGGALEERFTGIVPQLLNAIDEAEAQRLIADDDWVAQEKHDGHRRMVKLSQDDTTGVNRKGLAVPMPASVLQRLALLDALRPLVLDGELMGQRYVIFDVLEFKGRDTTGLSLNERLELLAELAAILGTAPQAGEGAVWVTPTARTRTEKAALYDALRLDGAEGAVFKRLDSRYVAGRPNSGGNQLKRKFTHSASFIVAKRSATKRSIALALLDERGAQQMLGNCTIPANFEMPAAGAIVEVEYLYAFKGGSVYQPVYKGERDDIDAAACTTAQLHFKAEGEADEADEG